MRSDFALPLLGVGGQALLDQPLALGLAPARDVGPRVGADRLRPKLRRQLMHETRRRGVFPEFALSVLFAGHARAPFAWTLVLKLWRTKAGRQTELNALLMQ